MATIKQIKDTEGNIHDILSTIGYGTCSTAAATAAKVATISDTSWTLKVGSIIGIKFTNTNTAGSSTTPVTLNVNSTGAKNIWYNNAKYTSTSSNICGFANRVIYYMYDGTYWVWMNNGTLDGNIVPSIQIETSGSTAAKVGTCTNYSLLANSYAHANIRYSNTLKSALTLNVNSKGAKPIYINGTPSSSSNYTLPAGTYIIYYDGSNYHFRTDGVLPGKILNAINDANGDNISTTYTRNSDFDGFTSYAEKTYRPMLSVNYLELVNLRDNGKLIPGQQYRIIDYITTTIQENTESAGHQFDIIVTANSNNTLSEIASACLHEGDTYFSGNNANLSAWQIWYCLDNDTSRFKWATNKGYTYNSSNQLYEIDKDKWVTAVGKVCNDRIGNQIDAFYETEINEKFSHFGYSADLDGIQRLTLYGRMLDGDIDEGLSMIKYHYSGVYKVDGQEYDGWAELSANNNNGIVGYATDESGNPIYILTERIVKDKNSLINGDEEIIIGRGVIYRMIDEWGNDCPYDFKNIKFTKPIFSETDTPDSNFYYTFSYYKSYDSTINDFSVYDNVAHNNVYDNVIKPYYYFGGGDQILNRILFISDTYIGTIAKNTFGIQCRDNTFGNNCYNNTFGTNCISNKFGDGCQYNTFGTSCYNNTFGTNCYNNTFFSDCHDNTFGTNCNYNTFGTNCHDNTFGDGCQYNTFGTNCYSNIFGTVNSNNELVTNAGSCSRNKFGTNCYNNKLFNSCNNNSFDIDCHDNEFGTSCTYNKFDTLCALIKFGNGCSYNTLGNGCTNIKFGTSSTLRSYYRRIIIDNGNQYIYLNCTKSIGSSKYYQNVRIGLGVNNTSTYKTITYDGDINQTFETYYKPSESQTILI